MKVLDKPTPKWFKSLSSNLEKIEANRAAYEDPDEGVVAPSDEVFAVAKRFIGRLSALENLDLEEPRISISVNGHLGLAFGDAKRSLDVMFTPKTHFYFKALGVGEDSGEDSDKAIELVTKYFCI